jgi:F-type H+-transporting ATPase subunit epsilon
VRLTIQVPGETILDVEGVTSIVAEGGEGMFGILPRHIDYVSVLVPGILSYRRERGPEELLAVDRGVLVKRGPHVRVSAREAVRGEDLDTLRGTVQKRFRRLDERERQARSALASLESRFIRDFIEQMRRVRR